MSATIAQASHYIDNGKPWLIASSTPIEPAAETIPERLAARRAWLIGAVSTWPAPLGIGKGKSRALACGRSLFTDDPDADQRPGHLCILAPDGGLVIAVEIGVWREDADPRVWSVGEGALAWLTICFLQLAGAWSAHVEAGAEAVIELGLYTGGSESPVQIWNFAGGVNSPAGAALAIVRPENTRALLGGEQRKSHALVARDLILPILRQFGLVGSRQIDADGSIIADRFVGHADAIRRWAESTGLAAVEDSA